MNDLFNNTIKPKNLEELYHSILQIVEILYDKHAPISIKNRKNKEQAKMSDAEIISIALLTECLHMTQNAGYNFLKKNYPKLVNYCDRTRFNRTLNNLVLVIQLIRRKFKTDVKIEYSIVDSFPLVSNKFGRALFGKRLRDICSYGYCASKKEHYYGMKIHVITDLKGDPIDYIATKANIDDRIPIYELIDLVNTDVIFGDKGYFKSGFYEELKNETGVKLIALRKKNMKEPLTHSFKKLITKLRRRIETTFDQLSEHFNIERIRANSKCGVQTMLEIKFFAFNLLAFIGGSTKISNVLNYN